MVVIMKPGFSKEQLDHAIQEMERCGVNVMISRGAETTILGAEGNAGNIDTEKMEALPGVERGMRASASLSVSCPKGSIMLCMAESPISCHMVPISFFGVLQPMMWRRCGSLW